MIRGIKYVMIFTVGAAIGGSVGWFVTKKKFEKTMDERVENEVKSVREWYEKHYEEDKELMEVANTLYDKYGDDAITKAVDEAEKMAKKILNQPAVVNELDDIREKVEGSYTDLMNRRKEDLLRPERTRYDRGASSEAEREKYDRSEASRIQYNSFSKPKSEFEEKEVDEVRLVQNDDDPRSDIYVINADQFAHERYGFDKVTLYWWELERILSEEDMAILDVPDILGTNWEAHIGEEEKDIVYVRNEPLETDYEVVVQHESFYAMRDS